MTKQTHRQRKALRSTKKGDSSLRRKTPPHPSPAALRPSPLDVRPHALAKAIDGLTRSFTWSESPEGHDYWAKICDRLAQLIDPKATSWVDVKLCDYLERIDPPTNEMGAERAHASEPVQSPAQQIASQLNSENLKPRPEPDPSILGRIFAWPRKLLGR